MLRQLFPGGKVMPVGGAAPTGAEPSGAEPSGTEPAASEEATG